MQVNINKLEKVLKEFDGFTQEEKYMISAILISAKSPDPSSQVGSCYVDDNGIILANGYNHISPRWKGEFPWARVGNLEDTKYPYIIHSEVDGIHEYKGDLTNTTLYVTLFPCSNCAKTVELYGIKKVVYLSDKYAFNKDGEPNPDNVAAKRHFEKCGVEVVDFNNIKSENFAKVIECYDEEVQEYIKNLKMKYQTH